MNKFGIFAHAFMESLTEGLRKLPPAAGAALVVLFFCVFIDPFLMAASALTAVIVWAVAKGGFTRRYQEAKAEATPKLSSESSASSDDGDDDGDDAR